MDPAHRFCPRATRNYAVVGRLPGGCLYSIDLSRYYTGSRLANALRLRNFVSPVGKNGAPDPSGDFVRSGASTIYREQGNRLIAVKFSVKDRDLAGAVADAQAA